MNKEGILIVVSGFSGAGKGTIMKALLERYDNYALSISATTRNPRPGEEEGKAYFFKTTEEFEKMIAKDDLIEYAMYVGNYYGTPKAYVEEQLCAGKDVILEIEIQGALKVKEKFPNTLLLFVTPPSAEELRKRLEGRGTETQEVIDGRMKRAIEEAEYMDQYDYLVVNDELDVCVEEMHHLIQGEHERCFRNQTFIEHMKRELKGVVVYMLHPSYTDLMKVVNKDVEEGETKVVNSRYSIVMATAKRAREIIDGSMPLVDTKPGAKPLIYRNQRDESGKDHYTC